MSILPPGISRAEFTAAIRKFEAAVGKEHVYSSEEDVGLYRDAYSPVWGEPEERHASAAVAPDSVEQVQQIVRIANQHRIPLYPISTGKNLGYGGSAPNLSGSVVVDLKRMNRILRVEESRGFALVEPGVSYFDLYRHLRKHQIKLWIDCPDPGWGSLVGNALDHGVGATMGPYRDHFRSHCGMEIVLPNGEVMRTGMGALPGADSWQDHPYGFGPNVDGLFAQGNYGIVTKMGFWLMPEPEAYTTAHVSVPRHADIHKLVEVTNFLENSGLIGEPEYASPLAPEGDAPAAPELARLLAKPGGPSAAELDAYATGIGKPVWDVHLQFYGPQKTILANWEYAQEKFSAAIPGASFQQGQMLRFPMTDEQIEAVQMPRKVAIGVPSLAAFSLGARTATNPTPQDGHLWFASIIPKTGEAILKAQSALADVYRRVGMPPERAAFQTPAVFFSRSFIMLVGFPLSRSDRSVNQTSIAAFTQIMEAAAKNGWGEYRAPPLFADKIMNSYSYNDHVLRRFCETLKDSVDPNGILAAGRGGIWPKHLRKDKV